MGFYMIWSYSLFIWPSYFQNLPAKFDVRSDSYSGQLLDGIVKWSVLSAQSRGRLFRLLYLLADSTECSKGNGPDRDRTAICMTMGMSFQYRFVWLLYKLYSRPVNLYLGVRPSPTTEWTIPTIVESISLAFDSSARSRSNWNLALRRTFICSAASMTVLPSTILT